MHADAATTMRARHVYQTYGNAELEDSDTPLCTCVTRTHVFCIVQLQKRVNYV